VPNLVPAGIFLPAKAFPNACGVLFVTKLIRWISFCESKQLQTIHFLPCMMFYCLSFARSAFLFKNFARSKKRLGTAVLDVGIYYFLWRIRLWDPNLPSNCNTCKQKRFLFNFRSQSTSAATLPAFPPTAWP
jgi:hypothetical protein